MEKGVEQRKQGAGTEEALAGERDPRPASVGVTSTTSGAYCR